VYTSEEARDNLAFRLYADGIRALRLADGISAEELRALVEILGSPAGPDDEDDIVTRLWSADLAHVAYRIAEVPPAGGDAAHGLTGARESQEGAIRRFASSLAQAPPPPPPAPVAHQVFVLEERELAGLQSLLAVDERRTPARDLAGILEAILAAEEQPGLAEFLDIVVRLCGDLLLTGRVGEATELIALLARLGARTDLREGSAAAIGEARARVVGADVLAGLSRLLAAAPGVDRDELRALVTALGPAAVEPFCRILGEVPGKETRRLLIDALVETGRGDPALFLPFLDDSRWYLVRNTIYILRRINDPEAARSVLRCGVHRDPRVRKEALLYFDETGEAGGDQLVLTLLGDETAALRVAAMRSAARRGLAAAAERLFAAAAAPDFAHRELAEREAVWEALGQLAPERALPLLRQQLLRRRWFGAARELDETACAVAGLRRIGTPEAGELLQRAARAKRGAARALVEKALRAPRGGAAEPDRG
jgi:hypothetical protein